MTTFMTYKEECEQLRQRVAELEQHLEARHYYNGNRGFKDLQTIAAQAAVIEALKASAQIAVEMIEYNKHERRHVRWKLNDAIALSNYTDSTQILAEVRRAERERCAKVCEDFAYQHPNTHMLGPELNRLDCAKLIRAME